MLTATKMTKVTLIEDINKACKFLFDRNINVQEFDELYDFNTEKLEGILRVVSLDVELKMIRNKYE